ncbi:hypothetical protein ACP4OV_013745 [Aristida adscensionis]
MGCLLSSPASSSSGPPLRPCAGGVRVVHTDGRVEDFHGPGVVTVAHVTAGNGAAAAAGGGYVLCSSAQLLQAAGSGPSRPGDPLRRGAVYFLLPRSAFRAESSAADLARLMNRLAALARKGGGACSPSPSPVVALFAAGDHRRRKEDQQQPPATATGKKVAWRPCLDRIDESGGGASSASGRSACSEA